ncbi:MAG: LysR family transcriptional regulator [Planctomycetes bacterium]|nr:LysR family transcriptional regulator [Planctomycetota bacterium]
MEIRQLEYLVAVADHAGFTKAAKACSVAQPSLSQQIAKLEDEIGLPLFERMGRTVTPTDAGQVMIDRARGILAAIEDAHFEARHVGRAIAGRLRVGTVATVAQLILPDVVARFARKHPDVELIIQEQTTEVLSQQTISGELDLAIVSREITDARLRAEKLLTEQFLLALPAEHHLSARKRIQPESLEECRFVLHQPRQGAVTIVEEYCRQQGFEPLIACRGIQLATVQAMVGAGLGVAFVPEMAARSDRSASRVYRPIVHSGPSRSISLVTRRHRMHTPASLLFQDALRGEMTGT